MTDMQWRRSVQSMPADAQAAQAWRRVLPALVVLVAGMLVLYRDTGAEMVSIWERSQTYAHGFLVPPIVAWLVWRRRAELARLAPSPSAWALVPLALAGVMWMLGELGAALAVTLPALMLMLVLSVAAVLGRSLTRALLFPLGFLFFAVPAGEFLVPHFMIWTADFTVLALRWSGIPVYREGLHFVIPSGHWSVIEACSGVRYLIASLMGGVLFAYLNFRSMRRRLLFVGFSVLVPVAANWVRAYLIVMLGHYSGNKLAAGVDHLIYGWVFFGVVIFAMFFVGSRWADAPASPASEAPSSGRQDKLTGPGAAAWVPMVIVAGALVLAIMPRVGVTALEHSRPVASPELGEAITLAAGWTPMPATAQPGWAPHFEQPSDDLLRSYRGPQGEVGLYVAYYRHQNHDRKLVSSENVLVRAKGEDWTRTSSGIENVHVGGQAVAVRTATLRTIPKLDGFQEAATLNVRQVYWINGHYTASDYWAKGLGAVYGLLGRGDDAAAIVVHAREAPGIDSDALLASFLQDNLGLIDRHLRHVRDADPQLAALRGARSQGVQ